MHEPQKKQKRSRSAQKGGAHTKACDLRIGTPSRGARLFDTNAHSDNSGILPNQHQESKGENPANESLIDHIRNTSGPEADAYSDEFLLRLDRLAGGVVEDILLGRSRF